MCNLLGFNTTKGSLIRSMLFPKPMGFKFYRDSMRFIAFLACIAGLGFLASTIQFIKLGVGIISFFVFLFADTYSRLNGTSWSYAP